MGSGRVKFIGLVKRETWLERVRRGFARLIAWLRGAEPQVEPAPRPSRKRVRVLRDPIRRCLACSYPLGSEPTITCQKDPGHIIHAGCRAQVRGRCPGCGTILEAMD